MGRTILYKNPPLHKQASCPDKRGNNKKVQMGFAMSQDTGQLNLSAAGAAGTGRGAADPRHIVIFNELQHRNLGHPQYCPGLEPDLSHFEVLPVIIWPQQPVAINQ